MFVNYFSFCDLIEKHDEVIKKSGGSKGVLSPNLIVGCLDLIRNDDYYPEFEDKLSHLVFSLVKNHGFCGGNKRSAVVAGAYFLEINSFDQYIIDIYIREMENIVLMVAQSILSKDDLKRILYDIIYSGLLSDETSLIYVRLLGEYTHRH